MKNITCPRCQFRHPAEWTCERAKKTAEANAAMPAAAELDRRSIVELDMYTIEALRLLYRGSELLLADIAMETHPQSVRNELHNHHSYLRAVLQSLGDNVT